MNAVLPMVTLTLIALFPLFSFTASATATEEKPASGGKQQMRMITTAGDAFILPECECLFLAMDSAISVMAVLEPAKRPEKYRTIDIQSGDKLLMVNGKRMKKPGEVQGLYDSLKVGDELKFAVMRAGKPVLVTFAKGEPIPGHKMNIELGGGGADHGGAMVTKQFGSPGEFDDVDALVQLGMMIGFKGGKVSVVDVLPMAEDVYTNERPAPKDVILSVDGEKISGLDGLEKLRSKLTTNAKGTLVVLREGKEITLNYTVPAELPQIMIKRN